MCYAFKPIHCCAVKRYSEMVSVVGGCIFQDRAVHTVRVGFARGASVARRKPADVRIEKFRPL